MANTLENHSETQKEHAEILRGTHQSSQCEGKSPLVIDDIVSFTPRRDLAGAAEGKLLQLSAALLSSSEAQFKSSIPNFSQIFQPNHQTLEGSFSAVSTPIFASKNLLILQRSSRSTRLSTSLQDLQSFYPNSDVQKFDLFDPSPIERLNSVQK